MTRGDDDPGKTPRPPAVPVPGKTAPGPPSPPAAVPPGQSADPPPPANAESASPVAAEFPPANSLAIHLETEPRRFGRAARKRSPARPAKRAPGQPAGTQTPTTPPGTAGSPYAIDADEVDPLAQEDLKTTAIKTAPAWLVSFVFHTLVIIILGLIYVAHEIPRIIALDATFAETLGAQLDSERLAGSSFESHDVTDPAYALDRDPSDDPLARPPEVEPRLDGYLPTERLAAVSIGLALTGRATGMKKALLAKYGGTATTEAAVGRALEWLKRNQRRDGTWSLAGPYANGGREENRTAATAMALLAFQGAGHTHDVGVYREQVASAIRALLKMQDQDGNFYHGGDDEARLYSQAQATIAVCEIYGMTRDSQFRGPAQLAVDYAVKIQAPEGGWRYQPGVDSDTSVTGWFVMGLQSALMAGLEVPSPTLQRVSEFLETVAVDEGAFYKYQPIRQGFTLAMTAEGLLCRQYLGWKRDDRRLAEGSEFLLEHKVDYDVSQDNKPDVYYWYYATQVLHHLGGEAWEQWNRVMRQEVPAHQVRSGKEEGSWDPEQDAWGRQYGGRLYVTCLSTYMLEVYYRHLPIYSYRQE